MLTYVSFQGVELMLTNVPGQSPVYVTHSHSSLVFWSEFYQVLQMPHFEKYRLNSSQEIQARNIPYLMLI